MHYYVSVILSAGHRLAKHLRLVRRYRSWHGAIDVNSNQLFRWRRQLLPKAVVESGTMLPVEIAPKGDRPRHTDRDGVIEIMFGCGARVRLRGEVSSQTLRQVIELLR